MKTFIHWLNPDMTIKINTVTKEFEVKYHDTAEIKMNKIHKDKTQLSKYYFEKYELVDILTGTNFCDLLSPCNGGQCHRKTLGFTCRCNPASERFGPLCDIPTPCTYKPCKNFGTCTNILHENGTGRAECDCSTAVIGFSGTYCNHCEGGIGVEGECIRYNSCLDIVDHCIECDNQNNPSFCKTCAVGKHVDLFSNQCVGNECVCDNGIAGDCLVHNGLNCESCFEGFILKAGGYNEVSRWCEACPLNQEPDYSNSYCRPCEENYFTSQNEPGFCEECPVNTVRAVDDNSCTPCPEHYYRTTGLLQCEPCPEETPVRRDNAEFKDDKCTVVDCEDYHYFNSLTGTCKPCDVNKQPNPDKTNCIDCHEDHYRM